MNGRILLTVFLLTFCLGLDAQQGGGSVCYRRILNLDSTKYVFDSIGARAFLFFRTAQSFFIYNSEYTKNNDSALKPTDEVNTFILTAFDKYGESVFTDYAKNKITLREFIWKKPYISEEPIPAINWTIEKDIRYFGKIICHKATAHFRGRSYTAWFTYEIPINSGPWKLQGLPGLILEASDSKNEVQFKFESIEIPACEQFSFQPATRGKKVAFTEFRQLWKIETDKIQKFLKSTSEKGTTIDMNVKYYPIEKSYE